MHRATGSTLQLRSRRFVFGGGFGGGRRAFHFKTPVAQFVFAAFVQGDLFFNFGVAAADSRVGHQPDGVAQIPPAKQGQGIRQPAQQIGAIGFAQGDDNRPAMTRESERNRVKEILVGRDEDRAVRLRVGEQFIVSRARRKTIHRVRSEMTGGNKLRQGKAREIFVEEKFHPPGQASTASMAVNSPANSRQARIPASVSVG